MITSNLLDFATALGFTAYVKRPTPIEGDWRLAGWEFPCLVLMPSPTAEYVRQTSGTTEVREFDILDLRATDVTFDTAEADAECETARVELLQFVQRLSEMFHVEQLRGRQIWDSANGGLVVGWSVSLRLTELVGLSACDGLPIDPKTIEITENGTYNVLPFGRAVVDVQGGTPAVVEPLEVEPTNEAQTITPTPGVDGFAPVVVGACPVCPAPVVETLQVTPTTAPQTLTPSAGVDGFAPVEVEAVTSAIDPNIAPENILQGVDILGVTGNVQPYVAPVVAPLSVTPSTSAQTITAPVGTDGYNPVSVSAVDASIDPNIQAGNIKQGVDILGVTGTMEPQGNGDVLKFGNVTFVADGKMSAIKQYLNAEECTELRQTDVTSFAQSAFRISSKLARIEVGVLTTGISNTYWTANGAIMREFTVGQGTAVSLNFTGTHGSWTATNVIAEGADAIAELNANIVAGLADRVSDRSGDTALTITFGTSLYNVLTAETLAAFTAKNWNVAYA